MSTRLIMVGGFLGSGKTTLLRESAQRLASRGLKVGLITNDQAPELVDTALLARGSRDVAEVSGSCFCCNFDGLIDAISSLRAKANTDMILAEPVGSCTDLSATLVQPIKERFSEEIVAAPLSVLVDPDRLAGILHDDGRAGLHPSAAYILRKQLEEADLIVINKSDRLSPDVLSSLRAKAERAFPGIEILALSALTGEGLDEWLRLVSNRTDAGVRITEVDYDVYAEGEAVLGWLNANIALRATSSVDWSATVKHLLAALSSAFDGKGAAVGHVKLLLEADDKSFSGNLTGTAETLAVRGDAIVATEALLTLNARVEMPAADLDQLVRDTFPTVMPDGGTATPTAWNCLTPGRPAPTHRYDRVVPSRKERAGE